MASRSEQKRQLRADRIARERAAADSERRRRRLMLIGASTVAALAVIGVLIAVSQGGGGGEKGLGGGESIAGVGQVRQLFDGIPQNGAVLGDPKAPVTMVEFADLQCPFCAQYTRSALPTIVKRYVRPGKLRIEFRPLTFIGPDSAKAGGAAAAAAERNRLWQFADLFYLNQGTENSGYVSDSFLRGIARGAGLDPAPLLAASKTPDSIPLLRQAESEAQRNAISTTPSFLLGRGKSLRRLAVSSLDPSQFTTAIEGELAR
jgi:protein-disulfide isomerase